ncbi:hypothetical protein DFQ30_003762 [Apophysomyces sp. BC1015]|nr:hypothetical protein DFQ30_003762 [Apophysomyces sp. BC1015]
MTKLDRNLNLATRTAASTTTGNNPPSTKTTSADFANNTSQHITFFPATTTQSSSSSKKPTPTTSSATTTTATTTITTTVTSSSSPLPPLFTEFPTPPPTPNNPSTVAESQTSNDNAGGGGLSGGAIGAICAVIAIIVLGLGGFFFMRRRQRLKSRESSRTTMMHDRFSFAPNAISTPPMTYNAASAAGPAQAVYHEPSFKLEVQQQSPASAVKPDGIPQAPMMVAAEPQQQPIHPPELWNLPPIATYTIVSTYEPTLNDEINVQPGDQVQVYEEYDDGWCLGMNLTRGQTRGVFPKHCVLPPSPEMLPRQTMESGLVVDNNRLSKRDSSLYSEQIYHPK